MPLTYERIFRVRHYECDAYGHVNNANYLRYMQEAAFDATAAAGYDLDRYAALGTSWLVRDTEIEYFSPLKYGESVTVRTWVADFRRVRSRRVYLLTRTGTDERVAEAATDWVYINTATGQPATIPGEIINAFFPEGAPPPAAPRTSPPAPPPPPPGVFKMRRPVLWQDIDGAGHVNNARYVGFVSDCGFQVATAYGWPASRMQAEGFGILVRKLHLHYRQQARLDDELEIATWAYAARRVTARRAYTITRVQDGVVVFEAHGLYAWVDLASGQPVRIPERFMEAFGENFTTTG